MPNTMTARNLPEVLDRMFEVAPDLKEHLSAVKTSSQYASPEMQSHWWQQAALVLNEVGMNHPQAARLMKIFGGQE